MSFNEKLQMLRKKNNLSQEELANMLDVTRQSVSKWESGITYPEMDKLLSLCKIFNCSLEELTNDDIKEIGLENKKKLNFDNFIDNFLELINKTYQMFRVMSFKDIIKCIFIMSIIFTLLLLLKIPFILLESNIRSVISHIGSGEIANIIKEIFHLIFESSYLFIFIFLFIYLFKIIYLDKIVIRDVKIQCIDNKEEKIVTYDKNSSNVFFSILGKIIIGFIKFIIICLTFPILIFFFFLCTAFLLNFLLIIKGIFYSSITFGLIFSILFCLVVLEVVLEFIFNRQLAFKRLMISFIISIAGLGLSFGLLLVDITNTTYKDSTPDSIKEDVLIKTISATDNLNYLTYYNPTYQVDETLGDNFKIEIKYYSDFNKVTFSPDNNNFFITHTDKSNFKKIKNLVISDLTKKKLYNYSKLYDYSVTIYGNSSNIENLKSKAKQLEDEENEDYKMIDNYEKSIQELEDKNDELTVENQELKDKIEEYKEKISEYKSSLKDIIKE